MVSERNRVLELKNYLTSLGINVNIGKNKARGHNGLFIHNLDMSRIDVSSGIDDEDKILSVLLHEFAHYIHYSYDKSMISLNFVFGDTDEVIDKELIEITVQEVPKNFAKSLYGKKETLYNEIKELSEKIKKFHPNFKLSDKDCIINKNLKNPIKYLLNYDRVKYFNNIYSVDNLDEYKINETEKSYIMLKSKQRALKRINSRICRINRYYKTPAELFARFVSSYYIKPDDTKRIAPNACEKFALSNIPLFYQINKILK